MSKEEQKATLKEVYDLIAEMRKEIGGSITRLETKFDNLEAGRLSNLETKFADFRGELRGKMAVVATVISIVVSIAVVMINHFWK